MPKWSALNGRSPASPRWPFDLVPCLLLLMRSFHQTQNKELAKSNISLRESEMEAQMELHRISTLALGQARTPPVRKSIPADVTDDPPHRQSSEGSDACELEAQPVNSKPMPHLVLDSPAMAPDAVAHGPLVQFVADPRLQAEIQRLRDEVDMLTVQLSHTGPSRASLLESPTVPDGCLDRSIADEMATPLGGALGECSAVLCYLRLMSRVSGTAAGSSYAGAHDAAQLQLAQAEDELKKIRQLLDSKEQEARYREARLLVSTLKLQIEHCKGNIPRLLLVDGVLLISKTSLYFPLRHGGCEQAGAAQAAHGA